MQDLRGTPERLSHQIQSDLLCQSVVNEEQCIAGVCPCCIRRQYGDSVGQVCRVLATVIGGRLAPGKRCNAATTSSEHSKILLSMLRHARMINSVGLPLSSVAVAGA
jgi:hypothetical protein